MNVNKKPRRRANTSGATLYPGHRPEYRLSNRILLPIGRNSKGRSYDSPRLSAQPNQAIRTRPQR
jgi:hypothetical protein